ncbi:MAG TPA: DUF177 domain-containing protein [Pyrinomonadaceae bacterium]|nr:DUF177 domain-containing protein [Pyrinomonadaceae bacterium]
MRIELATLEHGKGSFTHAYAPGELVLEDDRVRVLQPPFVTAEVRQKGARIRVTGRLSGRLQVECDRCLKAVELPVDSRFDVEYVTAADYAAQQAVELSEDDLNLSVFDGEGIDVDELVAEELLLAVPDHILCDENCKGMCAVCGADKNSVDCDCETQEVDPRWAGLKGLVNRE